jgi:hypothetical protein
MNSARYTRIITLMFFSYELCFIIYVIRCIMNPCTSVDSNKCLKKMFIYVHFIEQVCFLIK